MHSRLGCVPTASVAVSGKGIWVGGLYTPPLHIACPLPIHTPSLFTPPSTRHPSVHTPLLPTPLHVGIHTPLSRCTLGHTLMFKVNAMDCTHLHPSACRSYTPHLLAEQNATACVKTLVFSLNVYKFLWLNSANSVTKIFHSVKGHLNPCHPATSCVRGQHATTVPGRHMWEKGSLNLI